MSNPSEAHMGAAKHLLRCLAGSIDFNITYRKGGFNLTTFSDVNWCSNPDNGKSTSSYVVIMCNKPVSFKVGIQGLTAQSTMEAELVAAALRMKEAVYCVGMMGELGFKESPTVSLLSLPPVDSQLYCSFLHSMQIPYSQVLSISLYAYAMAPAVLILTHRVSTCSCFFPEI